MAETDSSDSVRGHLLLLLAPPRTSLQQRLTLSTIAMGAALSGLPPLSSTVVAQVTAEYQRVQQQQPSFTQQRSRTRTASSRLSLSAQYTPIASPFTSPPPSSSTLSLPALPPLTLEQLLHFQLPPHLPISLSHLSTLYALDQHGDGQCTLPLLLDFIQWSESKGAEYLKGERRGRLEGLFALKMLYDAQRLGESWLLQWLCRLVAFGAQTTTAGRAELKHDYIHRDAVMPAYQVRLRTAERRRSHTAVADSP